MEKRQEVLAPFSSDECPNSGEDSEEDVITDYLGSSHSDCDRVLPIINGDLRGLSLHGGIITETGYNTKDNTDKAPITMSEGGDEQQHHQQQQQQQQHPLLALGTNIQTQPNPLVPIISVTPHSPGVAKNYPVLEENLQQLHEIHDCIQRMRDLTLGTLGYHIRASNDAPQRLTSSCPSLCPLASAELASRSGNHHHHDTGSDPDLLLGNCSTNSSPTHFPSAGGHARSQQAQGIDRRRSWTGDLEDLEESRRGRRRYSGQNYLQAQNMVNIARYLLKPGSDSISRQRSISLSSLDSENELELDGKSCTGPVGVNNRACRSQTSTHSLNEADLIQNEYQKIVTKRGSQRLAESSTLMPGLTGSRLPLQKSISTPSIVTPQVHAHLNETGTRTTPSLAARHERNEKGSGSETETEDLHTPHSHEFHEDREGTPSVQISLDELLTDSTAYDDHHSEKTRRKRGSIFFRKKKDKSGKKTSQQHLWVTMALGTQGSLLCDVCMKHSTNKPLLHCDNCGASVHQSQGCKDQLVLECIKSKHYSGKSASKSSSNVSTISSNSSANKRGSTTSLPLPASSGSGSQTINEEKDAESGQHRDLPSGWEEFDFGDDAHQFTVADLEEVDPELTLGKEEPDSWSSAIGRNVALRLVDHCEREVKRQEHIYEFVLTEKHHCLVLLAMEKIFADGLRRHFRLGQPDLERMFPRLRDLIDIHLRFLQKLRKRQNANPVVSTIADILVEQFSCDNAQRMKSAYGEFCSRHRDAVEAYKYYLRNDPRFARFVRHCQTNPLLKKKGIPECILFVTQRLTKYPLLIEPLIKTGIAQDEGEDLRKALVLVKEILADVDACVADKEREDRKLEIYNKIDAKSFATYRGAKFKKSDIINRILKFEGTAYLMQGRGKMTAIVVVVLSDILFFLAERDQKYAFFVPDNKAGIVSLQKLLVREKARQESSIYLISSNPAEPEMFELKIQKPKDKQLWIEAIRSAVEGCPQDPENEADTLTENSNELRDTRSSSISLVSNEEKQRIAKVKESHILRIVGELRKKDAEQALLFEEKINLQMRLLQAANIWSGNESDNERIEKHEKEGADYTRLVHNEGIDTTQLWQEVVVAVQEATRLASSLSFSAGGGTLSRSLSSAGERHSEAYIPPALCVPRRAETFAGFDHNKERYPVRDSNTLHTVIPVPKPGELPKENPDEKDGQELETSKDQQWAAIRLSHHVYTLLCIINNQMTTIDSLQAQLAACKEGSMGKSSNSRPNPNRQLEELRNLQDQLCREKAAFRAASQQEKTQLEEERLELARQREQLIAEQRDVTQQRDQLYRRLEALERQGVTLVGSSTTGSTMIHLSHLTQNAETMQQSARNKTQSDAKRVPLNLISATNQQKVQSNLPIKQQLPLKLASGSNNNTRSGSTASNNSPDRHSRAGSSPAIVTGSAYSSPELGNSHHHGIGGGNHMHSSNRSLRITRSPPDTSYTHQQVHQQQRNTEPQPPPQQQQQQQQQQQPLEEEVIFF